MKKYELMCKEFCEIVVRSIYDRRLIELREDFDKKLGVSNRISMKLTEEDVKDIIRVLKNGIAKETELSEEFIKFYNEEIVNESIQVALKMGIYKLKRRGSKLFVWCGRPGLLIGYKGQIIDTILALLSTSKNTQLNKVKKIQIVDCGNPFTEGIYSLQEYWLHNRKSGF